MAATWDKEILYQIAEITAIESIAANAFQAWSPVLDVSEIDGGSTGGRATIGISMQDALAQFAAKFDSISVNPLDW